MWEAAGKPW